MYRTLAKTLRSSTKWHQKTRRSFRSSFSSWRPRRKTSKLWKVNSSRKLTAWTPNSRKKRLSSKRKCRRTLISKDWLKNRVRKTRRRPKTLSESRISCPTKSWNLGKSKRTLKIIERSTKLALDKTSRLSSSKTKWLEKWTSSRKKIKVCRGN